MLCSFSQKKKQYVVLCDKVTLGSSSMQALSCSITWVQQGRPMSIIDPTQILSNVFIFRAIFIFFSTEKNLLKNQSSKLLLILYVLWFESISYIPSCGHPNTTYKINKKCNNISFLRNVVNKIREVCGFASTTNSITY